MSESVVSTSEQLGPVFTDVDGTPVQVTLLTQVLRDDDTGEIRSRALYVDPRSGSRVVRGWLTDPEPERRPSTSASTPYVDLDAPYQS